MKKQYAEKHEPLADTKKENMIRPYTETSDMLIITLMEEDEFGVNGLAEMLGRSRQDLRQHIEEIKKNGIYEKIKRQLYMQSEIFRWKLEEKQKEQRRLKIYEA